jgi:GDP-4-dehydro-6-deoxy-D-mannose reductase
MGIPSRTRVLVTGASGFLASHLIDQLVREAVEVHGISDLFPETETLNRMQAFTRLDIRDSSALHHLVNEIKPSIVFHLAAVTNVGFSWSHSALTYEINLLGSSHLIEALAAAGQPCQIVLLSSAELYGKQDGGGLQENSPLMCHSPYALSKWAMERLTELFAHQDQLSFLTVRAFNFTGPGQSPNFVASDFARQIARIEAGKSPAEIEVGNLTAKRDFSDVRDIARYLIQLTLHHGATTDILNLCSGHAVSIQTILDTLLSLSPQKIQVKTDTRRFRPVDIPVLLGDPGRLNGFFGLQPHYSLETTLTDLLDYWRHEESLS